MQNSEAPVELSNLVAQLNTLGAVHTGFGPKHPVSPNPYLQTEIDHFFIQYPSLKRDQGYVDFLETFAAAAIEQPNEIFSLHIYGFAPDVTMELLGPDESVFEEPTFFKFANIFLNLEQKRGHYVGTDFAFDVSGNRRTGVYRSTYFAKADYETSYFPAGVDFKTSKNSWYCEGFIEWLERVVKFKGILLV